LAPRSEYVRYADGVFAIHHAEGRLSDRLAIHSKLSITVFKCGYEHADTQNFGASLAVILGMRRKRWIYGAIGVSVVSVVAYAIYAFHVNVPGNQPREPVALQERKDTNPAVTTILIAGGQWRAVTAGIPDLFGVFGTPDSKHLWAVGSSGTILQSDDGGTSWLPRKGVKGADDVLQVFGTADGRHVWAVTGTLLENDDEHGSVLQSDDVGATWQARKDVTGESLESIFGTADGRHVWAVGGTLSQPDWKSGHGIVLQSDDGGETWKVRKNVGGERLTSIFGSAEGRRLWTVGGETILQSDDGGASWKPRKRVKGVDDLFHVFGTADGRHVWAVGGTFPDLNGANEHGTVLQSDDGGGTWQVKNVGSKLLTSVFGTSDGRHLWAVGGATILQSDDGGASWQTRISRATGSLNSIFGTSDGTHLWVAGEGPGTILLSNAPNP
jgi:photosystem II stability/assembly factor-like uncharacterized protein